MYKYALLLILAMSASSWPTMAGARYRPARGRYTSAAVPSARTGYGNYAPSYGNYAASYGAYAADYGSRAADYGSHAPDYGSHAADYGSHAPDYGSHTAGYGGHAHRYGSYAFPGFTDPNYAYPYPARYVQPAYVG